MVEDEKIPSDEYLRREGNLRRAIADISAVISLSHTIRVFSVKWQLIRTKLEELNCGLISAFNCYSAIKDNKSNKLILDLISSVSKTLNHCKDLAGKCINVSYSGKLLMQSDLDLMISKLDSDLKTLSEIYTSGILSFNGFELVVSKPGVGATRDDMRFYVKDLATRLKIGDYEMKTLALISLNEIVSESEKYVKIAVELGDLIILLANLIESSDLKIQEVATMVVGVISGFECYKGVLVGSGVIPPLIRVLENGSFRAKDHSIITLQRLTQNADNAWSLSAHGGVTALLNLCSMEDSRLDLIGPACWVLRNLVGVDEIKRFMIDEDAIPTLIRVIKGRDEAAQIGSIEVIQSMFTGDEYVSQLMIKEGVARVLTRILEPKSSFSFKLRETTMRAIENLCFSYVEYVHLLVSYGFLDQLLFFLRKGDASIQEMALKSASRLCGTSEDARKSMGDAGFMPEFVKFLEAKSYEIREMAAEALSIMIMVPKNRKKFANEDHNFVLILKLLDPKEVNCGNFKFLLSILLSLTSCNNVRRKIANSGYFNNIEKLADSGVCDAKKIMRKLSTNRLRSMFNGIWHS